MKQLLARRALCALPALLTIGLLTTPTLAQPGMGGPGMNGGMGGPGMNGGMGGPGMNGGGMNGGGRPDRAAMQSQMIQQSLKSAGYTDESLLKSVTTYVSDRQSARKPLYDAANALSAALTNADTTSEQMATLWDDFNAALATEKARTAKAEAALDAQIGYSKDPKLAAALTLLGVVGDATSYLGAQNGRGGQRGMGGPGGQNGGGSGGMGGPGGPGMGGPGGPGGPGGDQ